MQILTKLSYSLAALLSLLPLFVACTPKPTVTDIWLDEAYDGKQYKNILVIGAAEKITFRALFEAELVKALKKQGIEAVPSYTVLPDTKELTRETVLNAVENTGTDGILITSLADSRKKTIYYSIEGSSPYLYYKALYDATYGPARVASYDIEILFLLTKFYDLKSEKLIWSMSSESEYRYNMKSLDDAITLIAGELQRNGLL